jgi:hypothetical protein
MRIWLVPIFFLLLTASSPAQATDFCAVFSEGTHITGTIRIKALMTWSTVTRVDGGDSYFYSAGCNNRDYHTVTDFSRLKNGEKLSKFLRALPTERDFVLEAEVTGQLVISFMPTFGHLSWSRSTFKIDQIHSIVDASSRANLVRPNFDANAPLTELAASLRDVNAEMLLVFLGSSRLPDIDGMVADEFTAIDPNGQTYRKANYRDLQLFADTKGYPVHFVRQPDRVGRNGQLYVASGLMGIESASGAKKQVRYETTYQVTDDSIRLVKSRFTKP